MASQSATIRFADHVDPRVASARPRLRPSRSLRPAVRTELPTHTMSPTDPRWVLAVRTSAAMNGPILKPDAREKLMHLGQSFGMGPFESNLVIAIVQDQARRGFGPDNCVEKLRFVPLKRKSKSRVALKRACAWSVGIVAAELLLLWVLL